MLHFAMRTWRGVASLGVKKITSDWADATWGPTPKLVTPCVRQNRAGGTRWKGPPRGGHAGTRQPGGDSNSTHTLRSHRFQVVIICSMRLVASAPPPPPDAASGYSSS